MNDSELQELLDYGQIAYEAYVKASRGKSYVTGADLPDWQSIPDGLKRRWGAAGKAVADFIMKEAV